jgi:hypothetical protein
MITDVEYLIWYMDITCQVISSNPEQVLPPGYMQYEQYAKRIQNIISNLISL